MNFKKVLTLLLVSLLVFSAFTGCKKTVDETSSNSSVVSDTVYGNVDIVGDDTQSVTDNASQTENSSQTTVDDSTNSSTDTTASVPNKNVNPDGIEIYGSGTKDDPYIDIPNSDTHTVKTLSIPAGKSVFYNIYRVGGRILTINDSNVFVTCDGTKHTVEGGKVSFKVVDALASDAVTFEIGNTSSTDKNFTITFADEQGSMANPFILKNAGSEITLKLEDGDEVGRFYKYTAEQKGTLKFYLLSDATKGILLATNNDRGSAQRSTSEEGEVKTDSIGTYIELEVEKGDEIIINAGIKPNKRNKYLATEIKWLAKY